MKYKISLIFIVFLAAFLRLHRLGQLPNSYTPDELAQGYTAYSILKTGQDEWGSGNWLNLRSFGDYKPPLQTLLMIPSIKIFGLTPLAVRLPNAIFSIISVLLFYYFVKAIFSNQIIALLSTLLLAISPWHLPMSRIALEANLLVFLLIAASTLILSFAKNQKNYKLILASILLGLTLFCYHSAKLFIPLYLILIVLKLKLRKKQLISFVTIFAFFLFTTILLDQLITTSRSSDIIILNPTDNWQAVSDHQFQASQNGLAAPLSRAFNNKLTYLFYQFSQNYLSYFSPQFLATNGAGETTYGMLPGSGTIGLLSYLGLIYAIYLLSQSKAKLQNPLFFPISSLILAPLAAALAKGTYSANRASLMIPFIIPLSVYGLYQLYLSQKVNHSILLAFAGFLIFNQLYFLQRYFFQANQILASGMLYGRQQAIDYVNQNYPDHQVIFSTKLSEPQAYVLFFEKVDPQITQKQSLNWLQYATENRSFLDQLGQYQLNNYTFTDIDFVRDSQKPKTILIAHPSEISPNQATHTIFYPDAVNQIPAIQIYQNQSSAN